MIVVNDRPPATVPIEMIRSFASYPTGNDRPCPRFWFHGWCAPALRPTRVHRLRPGGYGADDGD